MINPDFMVDEGKEPGRTLLAIKMEASTAGGRWGHKKKPKIRKKSLCLPPRV